MNEVKRILNFWKEVNLLTPVTIKSIAFKNQESLSAKDVLKVPYNRIEDSLLLNNDKKYEIEIGFGDIKNILHWRPWAAYKLGKSHLENNRWCKCYLC